MRYLLLTLVAFGASGLAFVSGFGLGTVLLPVFALFFSTEQAIAATAVVHVLNSGLRFALLRTKVAWPVVWRFGIPAAAAAPLGALVLTAMSDLDPITTYRLAGRSFDVVLVNVVIAGLLITLGALEMFPRKSRRRADDRTLAVGGVASGFIGGLSGLQGALRSAFLIRTGLDKNAFVATGSAVALMIDVARIVVYAIAGTLGGSIERPGVVAAGIAAAAAGTLLASRVLPKVTFRGVQIVVGATLVAVAIALGMGLL